MYIQDIGSGEFIVKFLGTDSQFETSTEEFRANPKAAVSALLDFIVKVNKEQ